MFTSNRSYYQSTSHLGVIYANRNAEKEKGSSYYTFGFNGKEKLNEQYGEGNAYDFGDRIHDPRISRWMSVDPLKGKYPNLSPYVYTANNPISYRDKDGRDIIAGFKATYVLNGNFPVYGHTALIVTNYVPVQVTVDGVTKTYYRADGYYLIENNPGVTNVYGNQTRKATTNEADVKASYFSSDGLSDTKHGFNATVTVDSDNGILAGNIEGVQLPEGVSSNTKLFTEEEIADEKSILFAYLGERELAADFDLVHNNCTDFAIRMLQAAGKIDEDDYQTGQISKEDDNGPFFLAVPNELYQDLVNPAPPAVGLPAENNAGSDKLTREHSNELIDADDD